MFYKKVDTVSDNALAKSKKKTNDGGVDKKGLDV